MGHLTSYYFVNVQDVMMLRNWKKANGSLMILIFGGTLVIKLLMKVCAI